MKKDVVGMDRPASEEGPTLEERVAELEKWLNEYCDVGGLGERVARLERDFEMALADWGENEPLPCGDLD